MRTRDLFITLLLTFCLSMTTSAQIVFQKAFGGTNDDYGTSVQQTADRGYIFTGATRSFSKGQYNIYLLKTDSVGDTLWTSTFGDINSEYGYCLQQTSDKGYIICGWYDSLTGWSSRNMFIMKTDSNGNSMWMKGIESGGPAEALSVQQTHDGGYIIGGHINTMPLEHFCLIKINPNGTNAWGKTYGGITNCTNYCVKQLGDGGYIMLGDGTIFGDVSLIRVDSSGSLLWSKSYGGVANAESGYAVLQASDGGFIISGSTRSFGSGASDVYVIKTDSAGSLLWSKTYGGLYNDFGMGIQKTADGGYILTGYCYVTPTDDDVYLLKLTALGDTYGPVHSADLVLIGLNL